MFNPEYKDNKLLKEQPVDIYITSSWYDDGNWMWDIAAQALDGMKKHNHAVMLAFDESILKSKSKRFSIIIFYIFYAFKPAGISPCILSTVFY